MMPVTRKYRADEIAILALLFAGCMIFFGVFFKFHTWFIEQLQVFLLTWDHFLSYISKPAFLSSFIGDFLTQLYWLNGGGAIVITITLAILWLLLKILFRKIGRRELPFLLTVLPVAFSWIALCDLEYPLSNVISLNISVLFVLLYISIKPVTARRIAGILLLIHLYAAAGSSMWIFTVSAIVFEIFRVENRSRSSSSMLYPAIILVLSVFVPLASKHLYLLTAGESLTYLSAMKADPGFFDFMPLIMVILTVILAVIPLKEIRSRLNSAYSSLVQAFLLVSVLITGILLNADFNLERIFRLDFEARMERWDKVLNLSDRYGMHTSLSSYYTNMALSKLGKMPEELMEHYQPAATGLFIPVNANENYLTITLSNEVYWHLGDVNASQHSALLSTIFSPRAANSRLMKRIAEINIVNGEYAAAEKYIGILEKTMFHRKWAEDNRKYLFNEDECRKSGWITEKRKIIPSKDLLKPGNEYIKTLRMLADNNPENRMAVDYLLCFHLLSKDIDSFIADFEQYYKAGPGTIIPSVYQEGLLIKIASGERSPADFSNFRFTPEIVNRMADYTKAFELSNGKGSALIDRYGKTYWFYYHFATMKTE